VPCLLGRFAVQAASPIEGYRLRHLPTSVSCFHWQCPVIGIARLSSQCFARGGVFRESRRNRAGDVSGPEDMDLPPNFRLSSIRVLPQVRKNPMRLRRQLFTLALILPSWAVIAVAGDRQQDYDIDLIVTMSGRCSALKIAGRDLACRAVKYFHSRSGRGYFTVAVDDASDNSHIISFSGEDARREGGE